MSIPLPPNYTAVPHAILREQAKFSTTELRIILVIADQTLGWAEGAGRRESAWISHERFKALTGRESEAVSRALASLIRRGAVAAETENGTALAAPRQRRAYRGRIFYRLADAAPAAPLDALTENGTAVETQARRESHRETENGANQPTGIENGELRITGIDALHGASRFSVSRLRKPKTIKEREKRNPFSIPPPAGIENQQRKETGEIENGVFSPRSAAAFSFEENALAPWDKVAAPEPVEMESAPEERERLEADKKRFVQAFQEAYPAARLGETVPIVSEDDLALLERRLRGGETRVSGHIGPRSVGHLEALLPAFFRFDVSFVGRQCWSLKAFLDCLYVLEAKDAPVSRLGSWQRAAPDLSRFKKDRG